MKTEELFERAPVWKSIFKMCLPTVVVMLVMTVYNMADMVFVGKPASRHRSPPFRSRRRSFYCR